MVGNGIGLSLAQRARNVVLLARKWTCSYNGQGREQGWDFLGLSPREVARLAGEASLFRTCMSLV